MNELSQFLATQSDLRGLTQEQIEKLIECTATIYVKQGENLFTTGSMANQFYVIKSGRFDLSLYTEQRGPQTLETIRRGEVLGWSWILPPHRWVFDAKAVVDSEVIVFNAFTVLDMCKKDPDLNTSILKLFLKILSRRLTETREKALGMYHAAAAV